MSSTSATETKPLDLREPVAGSPPPPRRDDFGDDDGRGRWDGKRPTRLPISNAALALGILICSLTMLFAGWLSTYVVFRFTAGANWPPTGAPPMPEGLWVSTLVLLASSGSLGWAQRAVRNDNVPHTKLGLLLATLLGFAFLGVQTYLWLGLSRQGLTEVRLYGDMFYLLTIGHGAHVLVGLVSLSWVTGRGLAGHYSRRRHRGIGLVGMYWHFLGVVWLVLFTVLYLVG